MPAAPIHPAHNTKSAIPDRTPTVTAAETANDVAYRGARTLIADPEHFTKGREPQAREKSGKLSGGRTQVEIMHDPPAPWQFDPRLLRVELPRVDIHHRGIPRRVHPADPRQDVEIRHE